MQIRRISVIVGSARGRTFVSHIPESDPSRSKPRLGAIMSVNALHASAGFGSSWATVGGVACSGVAGSEGAGSRAA